MHKNKYTNFNHFILRTPLQPINILTKLLADEATPNSELKKLCEQKEVQEAIFLASPNLLLKIQKWLNGELNDSKEIVNLPQSIYKYLARMSSRCTPFGLFTGNSIGQITNETNFELPPLSDYRKTTRLDMNYLCALTQDLLKNDAIGQAAKFFTNTSIYHFGDNLRYTEYYYQNNKRFHQISEVEDSEYLQRILKKSKNGAMLNELAESINCEDVDSDEAKEFISELIDSQLLTPEFAPATTGNSSFENILDFLKNKKQFENIYNQLFDIFQDLKRIDQHPPGLNTKFYHDIIDKLGKINTDYEIKYLFQADMIKPTKTLSLNKELVDLVQEGIEVLNIFTQDTPINNLTKFKNAFRKKYEDKEVPLLQALDTESGIGFLQNSRSLNGDLNPLIDDIILPEFKSTSQTIEWNIIHSYLFQKYLSAIKQGDYQVTLTDIDIVNLKAERKDRNKLPVTISSIVQLIKLNGEDKIVMESAGGSSAANLLGRFCHTNNEIKEHVAAIKNREEAFYKDKIVAEIVHLPESRTGNILHRPVLHKYEIPYLANSSVKKEQQILPEDIMVSVKNNKVILRSKRLNKEIIPRLTTAHNYSKNALPVYHFLCSMQTQGLKPGVGFNWGPLSDQYPFLPRVCYKNLIFSLAKWNIQKSDVEKLIKIHDDKILLEEIDKWRDSLKMPLWVSIEDGDNELPVKLNNILSVKTLISLVKNREKFVLKEFFAEADNMVTKGAEGTFTNEVILSFYRNTN